MKKLGFELQVKNTKKGQGQKKGYEGKRFPTTLLFTG